MKLWLSVTKKMTAPCWKSLVTQLSWKMEIQKSKIAKYITKSNDESGVAHAIRTWVL